jgi:ABC-2 type transport system permease protein
MFLLQLRSELWKLFGKKRTYIGFLFFLLGQMAIVLLFRFGAGPARGINRMLEANGYVARDFITSLTVATFMLFPIAYLLLPLYVSLVGGDLLAKEAEDGTLRMILARPVSRVRLLFLKWVAGSLFAFVLALALGLSGLACAAMFFPWGGLFAFAPPIFRILDAASGWKYFLLAHLVLSLKAVTIMGLAFMFSCFNMKPAAATILALSYVFANMILQNIPFFTDYAPWFLTTHLDLWQMVFIEPLPWWKIAQSFSLLIGFNTTFFVIGGLAFYVRDIKS